jgi:RimJ/RimL family protein N-acetyltransferase
VHLALTTCEVRSWRRSDAQSLATHANNHRIWLNLRDRFPHPYTKGDARAFIRSTAGQQPETAFAIVVQDEAVGGIGVVPNADVERVSAEVGYWLAERLWGRGIMTEVLAAVTRHAGEAHHLTRIYALPFASNVGSCRVLEKAGYVLEGRLRRSAIKDGRVIDQLQYAFIFPDERAADSMI